MWNGVAKTHANFVGIKNQIAKPYFNQIPNLDVDNDGIRNDSDQDIDGDGIENKNDPDIDGDGISNGIDPDADGDGIPDAEDDTPGGPS